LASIDDQADHAPPPTADFSQLLQDPRNPLHHVPVEISVVIGRARPKVSELINFQVNSVISLDTKIDDLVEIYAGDKLIARGELVAGQDESNAALSVKMVEVAGL